MVVVRRRRWRFDRFRIAATFVLALRSTAGRVLSDRSKRCRCQGGVLTGYCERTTTTTATGQCCQGVATVDERIGGAASWELAIAIATDKIATSNDVVVAGAADVVATAAVVDVVIVAAAVADIATVAVVSQGLRTDRVRFDLEIAHGRFHSLGGLEIKAMMFL